jgi:hypothetical protein
VGLDELDDKISGATTRHGMDIQLAQKEIYAASVAVAYLKARIIDQSSLVRMAQLFCL